MIIWSRMGFLVAVFVLASNALLALMLETLFGAGYFGKHPWAVGLGFFMGGLLSSAVGFAIRPRGGRQVIDAQTRKRFVIRDPDHTFFFIPMHWAGLVVAGIGVIVAVGELFVPASNGKPALAAARQRAQAPAAMPGVLPPRAVNPNPAPVFAPKALNPFAADVSPAGPPAADARPPAVAAQPPAVAANPPAPAALLPDAEVPAAEPPAVAARERAARPARLGDIPGGTRAVGEDEKLEVGMRVVANWGAAWDVGIVDAVDEGTAHINFSRLADGFDENIEYDLIRIPLPLEEIDPKQLRTVNFQLFPGTRLTSKDLPRVEEAMLRLEGYVPDTVKLTPRSRRFSFVAVRESFLDRFRGHAFLEMQLPHGRELPE